MMYGNKVVDKVEEDVYAEANSLSHLMDDSYDIEDLEYYQDKMASLLGQLMENEWRQQAFVAAIRGIHIDDVDEYEYDDDAYDKAYEQDFLLLTQSEFDALLESIKNGQEK